MSSRQLAENVCIAVYTAIEWDKEARMQADVLKDVRHQWAPCLVCTAEERAEWCRCIFYSRSAWQTGASQQNSWRTT